MLSISAEEKNGTGKKISRETKIGAKKFSAFTVAEVRLVLVLGVHRDLGRGLDLK